MSPRRQPLCLYQLCLNHMASVLESLALYHKADFDHPEIQSVLTYILTNLPTFVQASIGESIITRSDRLQTSFYASHIRILLRLRVRRLSLQGSVVQSEVLQHEDASHLERLTLYYGGYGDRGAKIHNFLYSATNITHLECIDFCNNDMLGIVASSCPNLYCLNLRGCGVSDEGVLKLCGLEQSLLQCINILSSGDRIIPRSRCALTLKEIKLTMTKVTEAGVAIVLLVLTNIHLLRVPDITMVKLFTFLRTIDHTGVQSNLKVLHSREILDEDQLTVLTELCPNLEYIQMSFVGNFDIDLIRLQKLTRLKKLSGAKFADVNTDALMLFLSEIGIQLKNLFLYIFRTKYSPEQLKISHAHLWNLARLCPNINSLTLDGYSLDEDSIPITNNGNHFHFFQSLQTLKLHFMKLSVEDLKLFLYKCTNMKTLELRLTDPHVLHDRFVSELLKEGVWKNLNCMNTINSHITLKMMIRLVNECPNLQSLGSVTTWHVTRDQMIGFKEQARRENLNIIIS